MLKSTTFPSPQQIKKSNLEQLPLVHRFTLRAGDKPVEDLLADFFRRRRFSIRKFHEGATTWLYASRGSAGPWFSFGLHISLVLVVAGFAWGGVARSETRVVLPVGEQAEVVTGSHQSTGVDRFTIRLDDFTTLYDASGAIDNWVSRVTIINNGREMLAFKVTFGAYLGAAVLYLADFWTDRPAAARWATALAWLGLLSNTAALGARIAVTGRLPLANLYEYGLCFAWGIMLGYLLLQLKIRVRGLGVFAALIGFLVIALISLLPRETGDLMPALRSKWLTYHVLTAIVAYSAFALSFAGAVLYLIASGDSPLLAGLRRHLPDREFLDRLIYRAVVVGLPFQTLLIITGAIWAQYAWGAYWSWDPKETWSLITWLVYAAYLHARFVLGWRGRPAAYLAVAGFYKGSEPRDKLSEYPFQLVLLDGWGMGVEFNEPRGHVYMLKDQLDVDPSRRKAGGVCLSCKSPYAPQLKEQMGLAYFQEPYDRVHAMIPENHAELGLSCIDCHDPASMDLKLSRWFMDDALKALGKDPASLTRQEKRTLVCAQCHNTYVIPKDKNMKSTGLFLPWQESEWGKITIEDIESVIKSDPANLEWKNNPTGIKLGHIRHPEFELYSNGSVHWRAGVACADCHMPYERVGNSKISSHHVQSPLKDNMRACTQCHNQDPQWLREQVILIQDRVNNLYTRAGNAAAQAAKAIELANKTSGVDRQLLDQAKRFYEKAYYRVTFIGAENSMGFHNPEEALRVLGDGLYYADQALMKAREALVKAGVEVPDKFDLELSRYAKRGTKEVPYRPEQNLEFTFDGTK